jgi:hypothetical protein
MSASSDLRPMKYMPVITGHRSFGRGEGALAPTNAQRG